MVSKEQVWQCLMLELPAEELCKINQAKEYEIDDYYNYDILCKTLNK